MTTGRLRGGRAHFRGLRLVHTHLKDEALTRDDLADLANVTMVFEGGPDVIGQGAATTTAITDAIIAKL